MEAQQTLLPLSVRATQYCFFSFINVFTRGPATTFLLLDKQKKVTHLPIHE